MQFSQPLFLIFFASARVLRLISKIVDPLCARSNAAFTDRLLGAIVSKQFSMFLNPRVAAEPISSDGAKRKDKTKQNTVFKRIKSNWVFDRWCWLFFFFPNCQYNCDCLPNGRLSQSGLKFPKLLLSGLNRDKLMPIHRVHTWKYMYVYVHTDAVGSF